MTREMIIEVDPGSPTPPYEQIRSQIAAMISSGVLPAGTQLPPIRQLAADLGLAANTVARAYRELEAAGLAHSRVRHGTVVTAGHAELSSVEIGQRLQEAARSYATTAHHLGVEPAAALEAVRTALDNLVTAESTDSDH